MRECALFILADCEGDAVVQHGRQAIYERHSSDDALQMHAAG
jgi:hypothetical protein